MVTATAIRIQAADSAVPVLSSTPSITQWSGRYFGHWWNATVTEATEICTGPVVLADVDPDRYAALGRQVTDTRHEQIVYARVPLLVAEDRNGTIRAFSPGDQLAYISEPHTGRLTIVGTDAEAVAVATARLAREVVRGLLLRDGWTLLHASAAVIDGNAILSFGSKGAGKTTTALLLARKSGAELLANDRIFVRRDDTGTVQVLPWPSAAALGLGLLDALGMYDVVRERVQAGEQLHPTQDRRVTEALLEGRREPLWAPNGKEMKVQLHPDQFPDWFGIRLASSARAAMLLFPSVFPDAEPRTADEARGLTESDFMTGATEDRYPDVFRLIRVNGGGRPQDREHVATYLSGLPHHSIVLGHDIDAAGEFLTKITTSA
ncbi:hypothetical protein EYS09_04105 [Streptomyces kasugaensis]|uniref:Uncharacterized protein n=1 Tax=Streptomyces kasugaensis TaxID=1946 RepID=A0A4Q9I1U5_STRKA|nr:hypothetical protein [Streptomyces kasugaensis]TBO60889.1 hypothetical protein EYS09_04105 [Streptomyces kasugaensis]